MTDQTYYTVLTLGSGLYLMLCAIAGGYVSTEKNRSLGEGMLFGLLFGPLGVVAAACMPDRAEAPAAASQPGGLTEAQRKYLGHADATPERARAKGVAKT